MQGVGIIIAGALIAGAIAIITKALNGTHKPSSE
jgi:hypothetical protein